MKCTSEQINECDCPLARYGRCVNDRSIHKTIDNWALDVKSAWFQYQKNNNIENLIKLRDAIEEQYDPT